MQVGFPKSINWRMDGAGGFVNFNWNHHIGLDYHVGHRWELRASYEYQFPPNFSNEPKFGMHPNGFQTGVAYRIHY
jgi:hypothetical protein